MPRRLISCVIHKLHGRILTYITIAGDRVARRAVVTTSYAIVLTVVVLTAPTILKPRANVRCVGYEVVATLTMTNTIFQHEGRVQAGKTQTHGRAA